MTRVRFAWLLLLASLAGMTCCLWLWWTDNISDRAMLGITLALSWLAITVSALDVLYTAHVRDDVESG